MMDVIEEILTRLPVKHVLRCKLLSKSCYHLINTPSFIKKHSLRNHQSDSSSKIIVGKRNNLEDNGFSWVVYTLPSSSSSSSYEGGESQVSIPPCYLFEELVGSCNGLLVFSVGMLDILTVCNLATRKYMSLPKSPRERMLMSNHIKSYTAALLGFAHDAKSGDYKLFKIGKYINIDDTSSSLIEVWSINTSSWKQINPVPVPPPLISENTEKRYIFHPNYGLFVNGILYWLAHGYHSGRDATILSFDPTNNQFGEIALPKEVAQNNTYGTNVIDFMGSLALSLSRGDTQQMFDIWVMGRDSVWTKRFSIGPFPTRAKTSQMCINGNFVVYARIPPSLESKENCRIFLYDPHRNKVVTEATVKGLQFHSSTAWGVTESLASV